MKFIALWQVKAERRAAAVHQFTTFAKNHSGIQIVNRWHRADCSGGGMIFQATDSRAIAVLSSAWSSLLDIDISPVVDDVDIMFLQTTRP